MNLTREIIVSPEEQIQIEINSKIERFSLETKLNSKWSKE